MRWEDERYVRVYTRDTVNWKITTWQGKAVLVLLFRKVDRAGLLDVGDHGMDGIAAMVDLPLDIVRAGMESLIERGTVTLRDGTVTVTHFIEAQEARASDRARARTKRERDRDGVTRRDATVTPRDATVTPRDATVTESHTPSRGVTPSHTPSHGVTPSLAFLAVPEEEKNTDANGAELDLGPHPRAEPAVRSPGSNGKRHRKEPHPDFADFRAWWCRSYLKRYQTSYVWQGAKDNTIARRMLDELGLEELSNRCRAAFRLPEDNFIASGGMSLGRISQWINQLGEAAHTQPRRRDGTDIKYPEDDGPIA